MQKIIISKFKSHQKAVAKWQHASLPEILSEVEKTSLGEIPSSAKSSDW